MASLTLTLAAIAVFGGGNGSELARTLGEATSKPTVIECGSGQSFKSFEFDPSDDNELTRTILKATNLKRAPGVEHAYHWPSLPSWMFALEGVRTLANDQERVAGGGHVLERPIQDGLVSLPGALRAAYVSYHGLAQWNTSKPLVVDPFFQRAGFAFRAVKVPERDFLNLVAKAAGARIRMAKDAIHFEPNGVEVQRRALVTLAEVRKDARFARLPEFQRAETELSAAAIATASPAQLESLVTDQTSSLKLMIGPSLRQAAIRILKALTEMESQNMQTAQQQSFGPPDPNRRTSFSPSSAERFRNLDPRLLGYAVMSKGFTVRMELATVDGLGRPGEPIRVP